MQSLNYDRQELLTVLEWMSPEIFNDHSFTLLLLQICDLISTRATIVQETFLVALCYKWWYDSFLKAPCLSICLCGKPKGDQSWPYMRQHIEKVKAGSEATLEVSPAVGWLSKQHSWPVKTHTKLNFWKNQCSDCDFQIPSRWLNLVFNVLCGLWKNHAMGL